MGLNTSNAIAKPANELEVAASLAQFHQGGLSMNDAIQKARSGAMACSTSLHHIAHFVQHYGGGPDFPLISFLQRFSFLAILAFLFTHLIVLGKCFSHK